MHMRTLDSAFGHAYEGVRPARIAVSAHRSACSCSSVTRPTSMEVDMDAGGMVEWSGQSVRPRDPAVSPGPTATTNRQLQARGTTRLRRPGVVLRTCEATIGLPVLYGRAGVDAARAVAHRAHMHVSPEGRGALATAVPRTLRTNAGRERLWGARETMGAVAVHGSWEAEM